MLRLLSRLFLSFNIRTLSCMKTIPLLQRDVQEPLENRTPHRVAKHACTSLKRLPNSSIHPHSTLPCSPATSPSSPPPPPPLTAQSTHASCADAFSLAWAGSTRTSIPSHTTTTSSGAPSASACSRSFQAKPALISGYFADLRSDFRGSWRCRFRCRR